MSLSGHPVSAVSRLPPCPSCLTSVPWPYVHIASSTAHPPCPLTVVSICQRGLGACWPWERACVPPPGGPVSLSLRRLTSCFSPVFTCEGVCAHVCGLGVRLLSAVLPSSLSPGQAARQLCWGVGPPFSSLGWKHLEDKRSTCHPPCPHQQLVTLGAHESPVGPGTRVGLGRGASIDHAHPGRAEPCSHWAPACLLPSQMGPTHPTLVIHMQRKSVIRDIRKMTKMGEDGLV